MKNRNNSVVPHSLKGKSFQQSFLLIILSISSFWVKAQVTAAGCIGGNGSFRPLTTLNSNSPVLINVFYHIIRPSNHIGGIPSSSLCDATMYMNSIMNQYGIYINSLGNDFIDNDNFYALSTTNNANAMFNYPGGRGDAINIYLPETINGELIGLGGCAYSIPSSGFFVRNNLITDAIILHELGHCLGLYHTHHGTTIGSKPEVTSEGREFVNGSNCATSGDFICDTPADPGLEGLVDFSCTYTGTFLDPNNTTYNPEIRNIMSYARSSCINRFSQQQVNAMFNMINGYTSINLTNIKNLSLSQTYINSISSACGNSKTKFSVTNLPSGYFVSQWESSNTSVATINSSGTLYFVSEGPTTLTAYVTTNGCGIYPISKTIYVGKPSLIEGTYRYGYLTYPVNNPSTGIAVSGSTPSINISLTEHDPNATFSWSVSSSGGSYSFSPNGSQAYIYLSGGSYLNITCTATNSCGNSPTISFNCYNYSWYRVIASPNPADQTLTVETQLVSDDEASLSPSRFLKVKDKNNIHVKLVDRNGNIKANGKLKDGKFKCNVNNLSADTYFLQIAEGEELLTQQVLVQH